MNDFQCLNVSMIQCLNGFLSIRYNASTAFFLLIHAPAEFMDLTLTSSPLTLVLILASKALMRYLRQHFLDKTFQGLYQVNAFDLALLIPYFIVLIVLAAYGAHRYWMVYLYYNDQKNKTTGPAGSFHSE